MNKIKIAAGLLLPSMLAIGCIGAAAQTPPGPAAHPAPSRGAAHSPASKQPLTIEYCGVTPSAVELGASATLTVSLSAPAPRGGLKIAVAMTVDGAASTIVGGPIDSLIVAAGSRTVSYDLQTQPDPNPPSMIGISFSIMGAPACTAQLRIN